MSRTRIYETNLSYFLLLKFLPKTSTMQRHDTSIHDVGHSSREREKERDVLLNVSYTQRAGAPRHKDREAFRRYYVSINWFDWLNVRSDEIEMDITYGNSNLTNGYLATLARVKLFRGKCPGACVSLSEPKKKQNNNHNNHLNLSWNPRATIL